MPTIECHQFPTPFVCPEFYAEFADCFDTAAIEREVAAALSEALAMLCGPSAADGAPHVAVTGAVFMTPAQRDAAYIGAKALGCESPWRLAERWVEADRLLGILDRCEIPA